MEVKGVGERGDIEGMSDGSTWVWKGEMEGRKVPDVSRFFCQVLEGVCGRGGYVIHSLM